MAAYSDNDIPILPIKATSQATSRPGWKYLLRPEQPLPLVASSGGAYATDLITVKGRPVGFMLHDRPVDPGDTGWRFFAGPEFAQWEYKPGTGAFFVLNVIANYDPSIISFLQQPVGCAFWR